MVFNFRGNTEKQKLIIPLSRPEIKVLKYMTLPVQGPIEFTEIPGV